MGKTSKWIISFLTGKKDRDKGAPSTQPTTDNPATTPIAITPSTPKEKRRWSFRRPANTSPTTNKDSNSMDNAAAPTMPSPPPLPVQVNFNSENEQKKHAMAMAAATAAAADAAIAAAQAAAAVIRLTAAAAEKQNSPVDEAAAIKIQSVFRSYLARKALHALKGLVKLQALVRGHLVRKQAAATLRCMQALVTLQARARAQRIRMVENAQPISQRQSIHRKSAPSALTDMSPRTCSGHFEEYYSTAQSTPQFYSAVAKPDPARVPFAFPRPEYAESMSHDYPFFPNYMANTESSRAKVRSHSAPKQRPDSYERQPSRSRASIEGRNVPRVVRMQRSSSHVGATVNGYQNPWSIKLDRSSVSLKDSECGSTSTVLTNTNYCRSLIAYEVVDHQPKCHTGIGSDI